MTVFVLDGTVIAITGSRFAHILGFFIYNTYQALLADQLGSFGMAAGFGKLSTKIYQQFKKPPNIHKNWKILWFHHFHFFMKYRASDCCWSIKQPSTFDRCRYINKLRSQRLTGFSWNACFNMFYTQDNTRLKKFNFIEILKTLAWKHHSP